MVNRIRLWANANEGFIALVALVVGTVLAVFTILLTVLAILLQLGEMWLNNLANIVGFLTAGLVVGIGLVKWGYDRYKKHRAAPKSPGDSDKTAGN